MASLDNMKKAQASNDGSNTDVELAVRMTIKMLTEGGGMQVIIDSIKQSKDPAQVIGQFLAQLVGQLAEKMQTEMEVDPRIFLAKGGWLEKILDYIEGELGAPPEFSDEIYGQVLETIKAAAMSPQQAGAPPQGEQPAPQAGPPVQGGLGG